MYVIVYQYIYIYTNKYTGYITLHLLQVLAYICQKRSSMWHFRQVLFLISHQVMVSDQQISDAAAAATAAIGVSPAIFPTLGVEFVPDATACSNTCPNWAPGMPRCG